jgi:hypothetical protein
MTYRLRPPSLSERRQASIQRVVETIASEFDVSVGSKQHDDIITRAAVMQLAFADEDKLLDAMRRNTRVALKPAADQRIRP